MFIIQPRLRYFRIKLQTSSYSITDVRKINTILLTQVLYNKIYGSENTPLLTDASGTLQVSLAGSSSGFTFDASGNLKTTITGGISIGDVAIDMTSTNNILTNILNDVSGSSHLTFDGSNNLKTNITNLVSVDVSGTNNKLDTIHYDVSGLSKLTFDGSNNLN